MNKSRFIFKKVVSCLIGVWVSFSISCAEQQKSENLLLQSNCDIIFQNAIRIDGISPEFPKLQIQMFGDKGPVKIWQDFDIFNNGNTVTLITHELPLRTQSGGNAEDLFLPWLYVVYDQKLLPTDSDLLNFHHFLTSLKLSQKDSQNPKNVGSDVLFFTNFPVSIQLLDNAGNHMNNPISQFSDNYNIPRERFDLVDYLAKQDLMENANVASQALSDPLKGRSFAKVGFVEYRSINLLELQLFSPTDFSYSQFNNSYTLFLKLEETENQKIGARIICAQNRSKSD